MTIESTEANGTPRFARIANGLLRRATLGIDCGRLVIVTPSGQTHVIGHQGAEPHASLHIHDWKLVWRLAAGWDVGFAESYMAGEWSSPDLPALLNLMCRNTKLRAPARALGLLRAALKFRHILNRNTRRGSRRNIAAHYDLGNVFYEQWLDKGMAYSSALYNDRALTLEDAQQAKLDRIIELLDLSDGHRVLEIGCGWGGLAETILAQHDCSVTGLTLSKEQLAYANQRLSEGRNKLQCEFRLQDYRDVSGIYDRIASIEMLEAVGEAYWPAYFAKLRALLSQNGRAVLQVITIGEQQFKTYKRYPDFIQRYIFPGGMLPTIEALESQIQQGGLELVSKEFFGQSYARTLAEWRRRFQMAWPEIRQLGFDARFYRMWDYYLAYCQAGFEVGVVNVGLYEISHRQ